MKINYLSIIVTTVAALVMAFYNNQLNIVGAEEATGYLFLIYGVSWLLLALVKQPFNQSIFSIINFYKRATTFIKSY